MPSIYAHYRFGKDVYKKLPESVRSQIRKYPDLYKIGLHGPDILFYYKPLMKNKVSALGHLIHEQPGSAFFERGRRILQAEQGKQGGKAYLYGFLCHYLLDSCCHGTVYETMEKSGLEHTHIETEFDRFLMEKDGLDPVRRCLTDHINPSERNAAAIAPFFQGVTAGQVKKALRSMRWYHGILLAPGRLKRALVDAGMRLTGSGYGSLRGMMMDYERDPRCIESSRKLFEGYEKALSEAAALIPAYREALKTGEELPARYQRNFEG